MKKITTNISKRLKDENEVAEFFKFVKSPDALHCFDEFFDNLLAAYLERKQIRAHIMKQASQGAKYYAMLKKDVNDPTNTSPFIESVRKKYPHFVESVENQE